MALRADKILLGKKYSSIEIFSVDKAEKYSYVQVFKKNDELLLGESSIYDTLDRLPQEKESPTILIINTANVLHREVTGIEADDRKLLHRAYPNLTYEEFYYEIWRKKESSIITICRRQYADNIVAGLNKKYDVAGISLGITALSSIIPLFSGQIIKTSTFSVLPDETENSIQADENGAGTAYNINGLELNSNQLLPFSGVLGFLMGAATTGNVVQYNIEAKDTFFQKSFFKRGLKTGIGILLLLLLINFFAFSHFYNKSTASAEKIALNTVDTKTLVSLQARIKEKEQQVSDLLNISSFKSSPLLDQLAASVPSSVLLSEINYHPLEKKLKQDEPVYIIDNNIIISGTLIRPDDFTLWIEQLEQLEWVGEVKILSYGSNENNTDFSIGIVTRL